MKIKITQGCAGVDFSFSTGQEPIVDDVLGADLCRANYAEILDADAQPPVSEPTTEGGKAEAGI